jgi:hypothetical protein
MASKMDRKKNIQERAEGHAYYSSRNCAQYNKPEYCPALSKCPEVDRSTTRVADPQAHVVLQECVIAVA